MREKNLEKTNNLFKLPSKRQGVDTLTCDIYTFANKKFRLVINAATEIEAYTTSISYVHSCNITEVRCVVLYKEVPEEIDHDTSPLKVHLFPKNVLREEEKQ